MKIEKANIVIMPRVSAGEFIKEMEGCIKRRHPSYGSVETKENVGTNREIKGF